MRNWNKIQLVRISYKFEMKENERFRENYQGAFLLYKPNLLPNPISVILRMIVLIGLSDFLFLIYFIFI